MTDNGIIKLDHTLSNKNQLSVRYFGATGSQTAFSGSPYRNYFQVATSRLHNYALALTSSLGARAVNQLLVGVNYFKPAFNDADRSADPVALGLNTGVTDPALRGAPTINLSGFAGVGPTQPVHRARAAGARPASELLRCLRARQLARRFDAQCELRLALQLCRYFARYSKHADHLFAAARHRDAGLANRAARNSPSSCSFEDGLRMIF